MRSDRPINSQQLLAGIPKRFGTMILGWAESDRPITINLERETNIAIIGCETWRNATPLRAMLYSLIARTSPGRIGLAIANYEMGTGGRGGDLLPFGSAPHLLEPIANTAEESLSLIHALTGLVTDRQQRGVRTPKIAAVIPNADQLFYRDIFPFFECLDFLLENGPAVGVHNILTIANPDSPTFQDLVETSDFSLRIIHREVGNGYMDLDFTAVRDDKSMLFRSAFISDFDLYLALESMIPKRKQRRLPVKSLPVMGQEAL